MKPSVILYKTLPDDLQQRLEQHFTVTQVKNLRPETVSQHADAFAEAVGLLGSSEKVDTALLEKMPKLRATSTISVGYDNFDVDALNARKVLLMHTPTVLTETVADTVMALVLSTARRVVEVANRVKAGEWTKSIGPDWFGNDVHHKTLGIVGMGRIGMALAQRAHAGFGMPILYNARRQHPQAEEAELLTRTREFVSLPSRDPAAPSPHLTGGAVDVTLCDDDGIPLDMGTLFDEAVPASHTDHYEHLDTSSTEHRHVRDNRRLLYHAMRQQGFTNLPSEWWHFDLGDQLWAHYGGHPHARYGPAELDTIENRWRRHIR